MMTDVSAQTLLDAMNAAHQASALRHNISHEALVLAARGSGNYIQSITAAMMTLGGMHAPVVDVCALLRFPLTKAHIDQIVQRGGRLPGWGNGFVKGEPDPLWQEVDGLLREVNPEIMAKIDEVTAWLHEAGKRIYPNPACYTAASALTMALPAEASPYLFVSGRLGAWTREFCRIVRGS